MELRLPYSCLVTWDWVISGSIQVDMSLCISRSGIKSVFRLRVISFQIKTCTLQTAL